MKLSDLQFEAKKPKQVKASSKKPKIVKPNKDEPNPEFAEGVIQTERGFCGEFGKRSPFLPCPVKPLVNFIGVGNQAED